MLLLMALKASSRNRNDPTRWLTLLREARLHTHTALRRLHRITGFSLLRTQPPLKHGPQQHFSLLSRKEPHWVRVNFSLKVGLSNKTPNFGEFSMRTFILSCTLLFAAGQGCELWC